MPAAGTSSEPQSTTNEGRLRGCGGVRISRGRAMTLDRRGFLHFAAAAAALPATTRLAWSQSYPTRLVTLIAPWPAGGAVDILCRTLAQPLGTRLGQAVIVE